MKNGKRTQDANTLNKQTNNPFILSLLSSSVSGFSLAPSSSAGNKRREKNSKHLPHMATVPSSSSVVLCYYTPHHQAALELEVSVLTSLLRRNACSQRRTKYYQRLDQAVRFLHRKSKILQLWDDATSLHREAKEQVEATRKRRARQKLFWELLPTTTDGGPQDGGIDGNNNKNEGDRDNDLASRLATLVHSLTHELPEALSRLHHSAEALWKEVARGFFLPFGTVALAAVARLRILLLSLAGHVLLVWIPLLPGLCRQLQQQQQQQQRLWNDSWDEALRDLQTFLELQVVEAPPLPLTTFQKPTLEMSLRDLSLPLPVRNTTQRPKTTTGGVDNTPLESAAAAASSNSRRKDGTNAWIGAEEPIGREPDECPPREEALDVVHDVGESVGGFDLAVEAEPATKAASASWDGIDRNLDLVERLRDRPKKDFKKKKKKERKELKKRPSNPEQSPSAGESKPSKRPKKKDFFDDLFGS